MKTFYAMRRANGDWFAVDDNGHVRMPIFKSSGDAMIARSRDNGLECFRPVAFAACDLEQLRKTDGNTASFFASLWVDTLESDFVRIFKLTFFNPLKSFFS